jgi:hypothetical protein
MIDGDASYNEHKVLMGSERMKEHFLRSAGYKPIRIDSLLWRVLSKPKKIDFIYQLFIKNQSQ